MRLNLQTDYALRVLMVLAQVQGIVKLEEIAKHFAISKNHLNKVAQQLAAGGLVETLRGRGGGLRLAMPPEKINVGKVVRLMENDLGVVECLTHGAGDTPSVCAFLPSCKLKQGLARATSAFLAVLDAQSLADITPRKPHNLKMT